MGAYSLNKTNIVLSLRDISRIKNKSFVDLVMNTVKIQKLEDISSDDTNLPKPILFELFPNLEQLTIDIDDGYYVFNPLSLLSLLNAVTLPDALRTIKVSYG